MPAKCLHRRLSAWIAMFAVLAGVLAPAAIHAMSRLSGDVHWAEVCITSGVKLIAIDAERSAHEEPAETHGISAGHCPYCGTHAGSFGLPPSTAERLTLPIGPNLLPVLYFHAPRPLFAWGASHARAPPVLA